MNMELEVKKDGIKEQELYNFNNTYEDENPENFI